MEYKDCFYFHREDYSALCDRKPVTVYSSKNKQPVCEYRLEGKNLNEYSLKGKFIKKVCDIKQIKLA